MLESLTPNLLNGRPNTYVYSKALSEDIVHSFKDTFPIAICRPAIVSAAYSEPMEGWVEGVSGTTGLFMGAYGGVIRTLHCDPDDRLDFMPVDFNANAIIAVGWKIAQKEKYNLK